MNQTTRCGKRWILHHLISSRWDVFLEDVLLLNSHGRARHTGKRVKFEAYIQEMRQDDLMSLLGHKRDGSRSLWKLAEMHFPSLPLHMQCLLDLIKPHIKNVSLIFCGSSSLKIRHCPNGNKTLLYNPVTPQKPLQRLRRHWPGELTWDSKWLIAPSAEKNKTGNRAKQKQV